jgi:uncharacterized short protein YbdD (DUF466 family)
MSVKQAFAGVRWYLREVSGESAYDRYVAHMRRDHPGQPVMSRRDFERRRRWLDSAETRHWRFVVAMRPKLANVSDRSRS